MRVVTDTGKDMGVVTDILSYPTCDLLTVAAGGNEIEVPMTRDIVRAIDAAQRIITVSPKALEELE